MGHLGPIRPCLVGGFLRGGWMPVSWLDFCIGRVLDGLETQKVKDSTTVVLHGDHGWQLGEHGEWAKITNFEFATHAPLMIHDPELIHDPKTLPMLKNHHP